MSRSDGATAMAHTSDTLLAATEAARHFKLSGPIRSAERISTGHINTTYAVTCEAGPDRERFIVQRINAGIFTDPPALMANVERVTGHLRARLNGTPVGHPALVAERRALRLMPAEDDRPFWRDPDGEYWRTYVLIERARTYDVAPDVRVAFEAARAFGHFMRLLADLPLPRLHETIPGFHDTPARFRKFRQSVERDARNRAAGARREIEFALRREPLTRQLAEPYEAGNIPERVVHNDTKVNNVLMDDATGEGLCVLDLDTVMPGLALHDFGDMVRSAANTADEDERRLRLVSVSLPMFSALVEGYLAEAGAMLTPAEIALMAVAGRVITFEIGLRFLTDYLDGDVYFRTHRQGHNLDRCRVQFRLLASMERAEAEMESIVRAHC